MGIKEVFGMESARKIRYAIVGLGDIAQEDMMPGVDHTGNSTITALITSDPVKHFGPASRLFRDCLRAQFLSDPADPALQSDSSFCLFRRPAVYRGQPLFQGHVVKTLQEERSRNKFRVCTGRPGDAPAYAGSDFIIARDGRIAAIYLFFDRLS